MCGSRSKIASKKSRPYIYNVKSLAVLVAAYIYNDISRLRACDIGCFYVNGTVEDTKILPSHHISDLIE
jgi:hypothetical protein